MLGVMPHPKGSKYLISYTLLNTSLQNYHPQPKYMIIRSFGPLGPGHMCKNHLGSLQDQETFGRAAASASFTWKPRKVPISSGRVVDFLESSLTDKYSLLISC